MTRRGKVLLVRGVVTAVAAGLVALTWWLYHDDPPPEDADLRVGRETIPDSENGYYWIAQAARAVAWERLDGLTDFSVALLKNQGGGGEPDRDWPEPQEKVLDLWDRGMACARFEVPDDDAHRSAMEYWLGWFAVASCGSLRSLRTMREGRQEQAFEDAMEVVRFGCRAQTAKGDLGRFVVAGLVKEIGLATVRRLAARTTPDPQRLRAAVDRLASCGASEAGLADAYRERYRGIREDLELYVTGGECLRGISPETLAGIRKNVEDMAPESRLARGPGAAYFYKPNRTKRVLARITRECIDRVPRTYAEVLPWAERLHRTVLPKDPERLRFCGLPGPNFAGDALLALLVRPPEFGIEMKCRDNAAVAATRLVLAIRAFELTHGRLPDALDDLVPAFIDAVPADDFDGKPMRWSKEKRIVYSVSRDLADGGGDEAEDDRGRPKDLVYHVDAQDAPQPEDEEAGEGEPQEAPAEAP